MNQNLLIVDDEYEILLGLEEMFRYEFDLEVDVYTANSAYEALELLDRVRFDVVLTDIKMPGMDGITLFERIKENWPRCKTVFLTGYRNFDDMYRVINDRDVRYVLKSEEDEAIMGAVKELLEQGQKELEQEKLQEKQKQLLEKAEFWIRKSLLDQIASGNILEPDIGKSMNELGIGFLAKSPSLLFWIRIEGAGEDEPLRDGYYMAECLSQIFEENMPSKLRFYLHMTDIRQGVLFLQPASLDEVNWEQVFVVARGAVEYSQEIFGNACGGSFSAVLWNVPAVLMEYPERIRILRQHMIQYLGEDQGALIYLEKQEDADRESAVHSVMARIPSLKSLLELRKKKEYFACLCVCLEQMTKKCSLHDGGALEIYYSVAVLLLQFINENHLSGQMAFKTALYKLTKADAHDNWNDAARYLWDVSEAIFSVMDINENTLTERALKRVVTYIDEHLAEELSLTALAEVGGFNASYLSRLFKQVKKETLSDYILNKRMNLAKYLLAQTNEKIQNISAKTGYISPHSFTRAFRKETGVSPKEYREMRMNETDRGGESP